MVLQGPLLPGPGTVAQAYGLPAGAKGVDHLAVVAVKDHVARQTGTHPSTVEVSADLRSARLGGREYPVHVERTGDEVTVTSPATGAARDVDPRGW